MFSGLAQFFSEPRNIAFFIFALLAIGGAVFAISFTKIVHMVVSLAVTFLSLAGLYVLLDAEFVAFVQVLIYAGAITILMIFGIVMTRHDREDPEASRPLHSVLLGIGVIGLFGILFYAIQNTSFYQLETAEAAQNNSMEIGKLIFSDYIIPFELLSVLLTVAFIGAIVIAKREDE